MSGNVVGRVDTLSRAVKTIRANQTRRVTLAELRPGDIVAEGIVVKSEFDHCYETAARDASGRLIAYEVDTADQQISVLARVESEILDLLLAGLFERGTR